MPDKELVGFFFTQGVLGVWTLVSIFVIRTLWYQVQTLQDKRLEEKDKQIEVVERIIPIAERANDNTDKLTEAMAERGRTETASTAVLTAVTQKLDDLRVAIERRRS